MIELRDIVKTYRMGAQEVHAVRGASITIHPGDFVAIMGPSGSGKSTLLHLIGCLDRPDSGSYRVGGRDLTVLTDDQLAAARNRLFGFVFQQFHLLAYAKAVENVEIPLIYAGKRHLKEFARERLNEVGLSSRAGHRPSELSGGEQQRVAIARALVNDPPIIMADEPTGNLDTVSEAEIIAVLERLNGEGKTIIVVTHEQEVADHARRIIRMRDGAIISDERVHPIAPVPAAKGGAHGGQNAPAGGAVVADHLRQALRAILTHPMRSALSMLGILIGVAAVITMLALGGGAQESIREHLASMGSNLLRVHGGSHRMHGVALEAGAVTRLNFQDVETITRLPEVRRVSPSATGRAQVVYGNKNWNTKVEGTGIAYEQIRASTPTSGRFFTEDEVRGRRKVALLGTTVVKELFGDSSPLGAAIKINRVNFSVIGTLPEKGAMGPQDQDDTIIIPITTAMYRLLGKDYLDEIYVEVADDSQMNNAEDEIKAAIVKAHHIAKGKEEDAFEIRNMAEIQEMLENTTRTMTMLLGSIAAISLLVGGIGIMNIMLVSVTERTREIGLRKALGARYADIMYQFLIESMVMTMSGGAIGVATGIGASMMLTALAGWTVKVSVLSIVLATLFSVAVGLVFGLWPARRAAALNPIEALRYE